jgi:2-polyprenyl-3-methyl-5-hydroxy-6-metoxy-1,4-benzoquinol methylase
MKAVICAAGFGSRLELNIPKAMALVDGKRIIDYQIKALKNYDEIYVVVGFKSNSIVEHLKKHKNVRIIYNTEPNLGIKHTMQLISKEINELALILDGDIIINDEIPLFEYEFIGTKEPIGLNPIYCKVDGRNVISFGSEKSNHEWACIYSTNPSNHVWDTDFIYETLSRSLPKPFVELDVFEIDTPEDKDQSYTWLKKHKIKSFWTSRAKAGNLLWRDLRDLNFRIVEPLLNKKSVVLDLGAGDCELANRISDRVKSVTAVDYIPKPAGILKSINYVERNILEYETDDFFDLVILFGVSNSLDDIDIKNLYCKIKKMINKTGVFIVKHQCGRSRKVIVKKLIEGIEYNAIYRTADPEIEFLNKAGFKVEVFDPYPEAENMWPDTHFKAFKCLLKK